MGQPRRLSFPHDPNDVKSHRAVVELETREIMEGSQGNLALLSLIDRGEWIAELLRTMRPDLNEYQRSFVLRHQINFSARTSLVSLNYDIAEVT